MTYGILINCHAVGIFAIADTIFDMNIVLLQATAKILIRRSGSARADRMTY